MREKSYFAEPGLKKCALIIAAARAVIPTLTDREVSDLLDLHALNSEVDDIEGVAESDYLLEMFDADLYALRVGLLVCQRFFVPPYMCPICGRSLC